MSRKKIILVGAGQLGVLVSNILKKDKKYSIAGFVDTKKKLGKTVNGIKIIGGDDYLKKLPPKKFSLIICIGDVLKRKKLITNLSKKKFKFPPIIDKNSFIGNNTKIGLGTIICGHSVILNETIIGQFNIIGTSINILHNVKIKNNCVIGGGSTIGSNVEIDDNVFIGVGSVIASKKIIIQKNSFICSGSVVLKDINKNTKVLGNPARVIPT